MTMGAAGARSGRSTISSSPEVATIRSELACSKEGDERPGISATVVHDRSPSFFTRVAGPIVPTLQAA
jgi:hypothetical protein